MTTHTKFVLLSLARSGSTVFLSTLGTHPDVQAHKSLFAKTTPAPARYHQDGRFLEHNSEDDRFDDPVAYIDRVLGFSPQGKAVGFKMWFNQEKTACQHVMADVSVHKIILERKNILAAYSSAALAQQSGQWHAGLKGQRAELVEKPKLAFDADAFEQTMARRQAVYQRHYSQAKGEVLHVPYDGLIARGVPAAAAFLGLSPFSFVAKLNKVNSSDILSRFRSEDHDLIRSTLDRLGHPDWVSED